MATAATHHRTATVPDLHELQSSWILSMRAQRKSPATIEQYEIGLRLFLRWCDEHGHQAVIDRQLTQLFIADLLETVQPATAALRLQAMKQFGHWLVEEGEIEENPLIGVKAPKLDTKIVECLTEDELRDLFAACKGKEFRDRRDEAIVRLLAETGMRAGEILRLTVDDVDLTRGILAIRKAKTGQGRLVPFGPQTGQAVDRYIRARRTHRLAATPALLLGDNTRGTIAYHGMRNAIMMRAEQAGIKNFHLHKLRHTAASRWLAAGGSEGGLMAVAGWSNRNMIDRYTRATAGERAAAEARKLNLGDL
ncbi:tyrosine-type recombinase/integrase [Mycobacterium sp. SMC-18]|uniref:tyrosine-type recombinase/integrase n=1 Tax=Mycobacteriaceae TaxID=1762 RepID=UPI001BB6A7D5|nr:MULTISPECIES: tyrosine-type recombinase/integrase [unclassified Mycolicibacterium]BCI83589.1 tyrosine recombinase XerC [Mycolicibacterium sp. TY66]BCJ78769.1 tyrosine recombinase XerC [Mycolicibacterium sp. TY81]